jgi:hypothetical protein
MKDGIVIGFTEKEKKYEFPVSGNSGSAVSDRK